MTTVSARLGALARCHPWVVFCCWRAVRLAVSLFVVVTASFAMIRLVPGDPVRAALGVDAPPDLVAAKRHELGLDHGLLAQYRQYLRHLAHGDLGVSLVTGEPVADLVRARLPATLLLAVLAFACVLVVALPGGCSPRCGHAEGGGPGRSWRSPPPPPPWRACRTSCSRRVSPRDWRSPCASFR